MQVSQLSSELEFYTPCVSSDEDTILPGPHDCLDSHQAEEADARSSATLYVPNEHGRLVALSPEQRAMRQTLADAGCLYDAHAQGLRQYIKTQIAKATEDALDTGTGLLNSNFRLPDAPLSSTPLATPSATSPRRPAPLFPPPLLPTKPAPSLSRKPARTSGAASKTPHVEAHVVVQAHVDTSGPKSRFAKVLPRMNPFSTKGSTATKKSSTPSSDGTVVPDYQDLNVTLSHRKVGTVLAKRIKRDVKDLYSGCKAKLGLDYPQS